MSEHSPWLPNRATAARRRCVGTRTLRGAGVSSNRASIASTPRRAQVWCVVGLPNGCVVSGSRDSTLKVWDASSGKCLRTLSGHTDWARRRRPFEPRVDYSSTPRGAQVRCVAALPNGHVVSGSDNRTLKVWDVSSGDCLRTLGDNIYTLNGHVWLARRRRPSWHADLRRRH